LWEKPYASFLSGIQVVEELQQRLVTAFPSETDATVVRGVREGILLADGVLENEPFLKNVLGRDLRGLLRRAGVLFRINDLCSNGDLPFESKIEKMPSGNWHWIELKSGIFRAHICRTGDSDAFPVEAQCRQDARLQSQTDLFDGKVVPIKQLADEVGLLYAWLVFGASIAGELLHLCWKMPAREEDSWLGHIDVLRRVVPTESDPTETPAPDTKLGLRFRTHIEEALSKKPDEDQDDPK
jgi:hypothetical protein